MAEYIRTKIAEYRQAGKLPPEPPKPKCTCSEPHYLPAWHCAVHGEVVVPMD